MQNDQDKNNHKINAGGKKDSTDNLEYNKRYGKLAHHVPCGPQPIRYLELKWRSSVSFKIASGHHNPSFVHLG